MNKAEKLLNLIDESGDAKVGDVLILQKGFGFYDTTIDPIGGKFDRTSEPIEFKVTRIIKPPFKGCNIEGVPTKKTILKRSGKEIKKLACNTNVTNAGSK
jgi:hypothetical protein